MKMQFIKVYLALMAVAVCTANESDGCVYNGKECPMSDIVGDGDDSTLQQILAYAAKVTGVSGTGKDPEERIVLRSRRQPDQCLASMMGTSTSTIALSTQNCKGNKDEDLMVWLRNAAEEDLVNIVKKDDNKDICAGKKYNHVVYSWDIKDCEERKFKWSLSLNGGYVKFALAADPKLCLTVMGPRKVILLAACEEDARQQWLICDKTGKKCYPKK